MGRGGTKLVRRKGELYFWQYDVLNNLETSHLKKLKMFDKL